MYGRFIIAAAAGMVLVLPASYAQTFPSRPIRLILPSAPGGTPDIQARIIAAELTKSLGQQVVVDNRPGAAGIIGYEAIARSAPDGYTLGYAAFPFITNPLMYAKLPFDSVKDFTPVILQVAGTNILTVTPSLPVKSVKDLIDHARANPGKLSFGSLGGGASQQLSVELLKTMTGVKIEHISYKAMALAMTDTISGQIQIVCENAASVLPHVRENRLRGLGVTGLKRIPIAPEIPTVAESGLPGYEMTPSSGYVMAARTPREMVMKLNAELNKALKSPAFVDKIAPSGSDIKGGTPEEFADYIQRERVKWGAVIKAAGIKVQ